MIKNIIIIVLLCLLYINWAKKLTYFSLATAMSCLLIKNGIENEDREILELQKEAITKITSFKIFFL